jgi:hypothetical protein
MPGIDTNRNRMLALIATVLSTAALRASYRGKDQHRRVLDKGASLICPTISMAFFWNIS